MQAHGVIGNQGENPVELEAVPSISLTLANMEGTEVSTFSITGPILPDAGALQHYCTLSPMRIPSIVVRPTLYWIPHFGSGQALEWLLDEKPE